MISKIVQKKSPPSKSGLEGIVNRLRKASTALDASTELTRKAASLIEGAVQSVCLNFPETLTPPRKKEQIRQEINTCLRVIIYCLVAGDTSPLDELLVSGLREYQNSLGLPKGWNATALEYIKKNHDLSMEGAQEANKYIDYLMKNLA